MSTEQSNTTNTNVDHDDHPDVLAVNTRNATILFLIYLAIYAGFMLLAAYWPKSMSVRVLAGVNLAIIYGMGLIIAAVLLAVLYMWLCARTMEKFKAAGGGREPAAGPVASDDDVKQVGEHEGGQA
jgi:uncharacterized membrane protein (DUF485 family)